jgi:recombinational DNA repair protein RecT
MNQQRQGGNGRQGQNRPPRQEMTQNQQISQAQWQKERVAEIVKSVTAQQRAIEAVLPEDVEFRHVQATLLILLRNNPDILECTPASIVLCCMKAAYDGVNLDGVEAAAIPSNNKHKDNFGKEYYLREARYNIMVAGVRKQIAAIGTVQDPPETIIVHDGDFYDEGLEGGVRTITWRRAPMGKRGDMLGVFSMARLKTGTVSYEVMEKADIIALKQFATQKGKVWEGKMEPEMWRKSVLRRHRKTLLGGSYRPDAEEIELYPDNPANAAALPAARKRPERGDYQALEDKSGTAAGVEMDLGFGEADIAMRRTFDQAEQIDRHQADQGRQNGQENRQGQRERQVDQNGGDRGQQGQQGGEPQENRQQQVDQKKQAAKAAPAPLPEGPEEWGVWRKDVLDSLMDINAVDGVNAYRRRMSEIINAADEDLQNEINEAFSDRIADLVSAPDAGAGSGQGNDANAGGED